MSQADIGLIGLAVMGENLALNIADHGFNIAVYNRTTQVTRDFVAREKNSRLIPCEDMKSFLAVLKKPRIVLILVKAGAPVDAVVQQIIEAGCDPQDIIVDCGNSLWTDTIRREKQYADKCRFFGSGVSGGELGARFGPALMPGGHPDSWKHLEPIWSAIAAKVDPVTGKPIETATPGHPNVGGVPCSAYIGPNGAGHYVKMVHNGIEYIDMQLICEAYQIMSQLLGMKANEIGKVMEQWNAGDLDSYLIQITADILQQPDPLHKDGYLVDYILDTAGQKGTGKWTSVNALDMGIPANAISEAVFARCLSALKEERVEASKVLAGPKASYQGDKAALIPAIREALYCSKICAYAQGFQLMREAQKEYHWQLDFAKIASIWRGGCIIRARFLQKITEAYTRNGSLVNLLLDPYFKQQVQNGQSAWRQVVSLAAANGIAAPAFMSALAYYDGYRSERAPANLLQGQRDYFGAHTYERTDSPRGQFFHTDWPEPDRPPKAHDPRHQGEDRSRKAHGQKGRRQRSSQVETRTEGGYLMARLNLLSELKQRTIVCDGGMGTQLMARGMQSGTCSETWNASHADDVKAIHAAYRDAGCDLLTTNTFGGTKTSLDKHGHGDEVATLNESGAKLAKSAAGDQCLVLGDVGPFGDFLEPVGDVTPDQLDAIFTDQMKALAAGGADAVIIETMSDPAEIAVAIKAAKKLRNWPVIATYAFAHGEAGTFRTMMGTSVDEAVKAAIAAGADVVGANCGTSLSLDDYVKLAEQLVKAAGPTPRHRSTQRRHAPDDRWQAQLSRDPRADG